MGFLVSDCSVGKYKRQVGKMGSQVGKNEYQVGIDAAWSKCPPINDISAEAAPSSAVFYVNKDQMTLKA